MLPAKIVQLWKWSPPNVIIFGLRSIKMCSVVLGQSLKIICNFVSNGFFMRKIDHSSLVYKPALAIYPDPSKFVRLWKSRHLKLMLFFIINSSKNMSFQRMTTIGFFLSHANEHIGKIQKHVFFQDKMLLHSKNILAAPKIHLFFYIPEQNDIPGRQTILCCGLKDRGLMGETQQTLLLLVSCRTESLWSRAMMLCSGRFFHLERLLTIFFILFNGNDFVFNQI